MTSGWLMALRRSPHPSRAGALSHQATPNGPLEMITGAQIRLARALLDWSPWKLARSSRVPSAVIRRAESVDGEPTITFYQEALIRNALQDAGADLLISRFARVRVRAAHRDFDRRV